MSRWSVMIVFGSCSPGCVEGLFYEGLFYGVLRSLATGILQSQCSSLPRVALGYLREQKYSDQRSPSRLEWRSLARATNPGRAITPVLAASCLSPCPAALTS